MPRAALLSIHARLEPTTPRRGRTRPWSSCGGRIYGPTTPEAFARWAGIRPRHGVAAFQALGRSLTPVHTPVGDAWILSRDEPTLRAAPGPAAPARLLPSGDAYLLLLQGADRELLVPDTDRRRALGTPHVWHGGLLVDGEIVGTWRRADAAMTMHQHDRSGEVRASDAEREAVVERLRVATVEGRLTLAELTERTEAAYTATIRGDLVPITADLPTVPDSPATPMRPVARSDREWVVALMGVSKRQGRWRVERPLTAVAVMGDVVLDLRGAEVPQGDVDITATAVMGDVKIYVPDGVDVQLSGIAVMGDKKVEVREAPAGRTAPKVVVRAAVVMGDVKILGDSYAQPIRRSVRARLTREDRDRRAIE